MTGSPARPAFLLDTNIVSEVRRRRPDSRVTAYLESIRAMPVCISCLTIGELVKGAEAMARKDPEQGVDLARWVASTELQFRDRILPVGEDVARLWGRLMALRPRPVVDTLIAATAIVHDMTLVTRNVADVKDTGVALVDPFAWPL